MKHKILTIALLLSSLGISVLAQAHDPAKHAKDAESPDCAAMENMDHSKMGMNDPVMQALMKQCTETTHEEHASHAMNHDDRTHREHDDSTEQHNSHQH